MNHEGMSENLYIKNKNFHTKCVFTVPDAQRERGREREGESERERERGKD